MFDIGFPELVLVAVVALLVLGPDKLPGALRAAGLWLGRFRRSFNNLRSELEREIGMDDIRRQLHNEAIMEEVRRIEQEVKAGNTEAASSENANARDHQILDASAAGGEAAPPAAHSAEQQTDASAPDDAEPRTGTDARER